MSPHDTVERSVLVWRNEPNARVSFMLRRRPSPCGPNNDKHMFYNMNHIHNWRNAWSVSQPHTRTRVCVYKRAHGG